jgi:hypothetical protein
MGDRCYLEMTIAAIDLTKFRKIVGEANHKIENGIASITDEEANYAWYDELNKLAKENIPFYGWNGEGGDYGEGSFCGVGGKYYGVDSRNGEYLNRFQDGQPQTWSVRNLRTYEEALKAAVQQIHRRSKKDERG